MTADKSAVEALLARWEAWDGTWPHSDSNSPSDREALREAIAADKAAGRLVDLVLIPVQDDACAPAGCPCSGHWMSGVRHMVPCCDKPHVDQAEAYRPGDIAVVEGRVAVYMPTRWEWLDGSWTAIPLSVGPVLGNVGDFGPTQGSVVRVTPVEADLEKFVQLIVRARVADALDEIASGYESVSVAMTYTHEEVAGELRHHAEKVRDA